MADAPVIELNGLTVRLGKREILHELRGSLRGGSRKVERVARRLSDWALARLLARRAGATYVETAPATFSTSSERASDWVATISLRDAPVFVSSSIARLPAQ